MRIIAVVAVVVFAVSTPQTFIQAAVSTCPCFNTSSLAELTDVSARGNDQDGFTYLAGSMATNRYEFDAANCPEMLIAGQAERCQEEFQDYFFHTDFVPFPDAGVAKTCPCSFYPSLLPAKASFYMDETSFELYFHDIYDTYNELQWKSEITCKNEYREESGPYHWNYIESSKAGLSEAEVNQCWRDIVSIAARHVENPPTPKPSRSPTVTPTATFPCSCAEEDEIRALTGVSVTGAHGSLTGLVGYNPDKEEQTSYTLKCFAAIENDHSICLEQLESMYSDLAKLLPFPSDGLAEVCPCSMHASVTSFSIGSNGISYSGGGYYKSIYSLRQNS